MNWLSKLLSGNTQSLPQPLDANALLIDVRTEGEFAAGHVAGALNLPLDRFAQTHAQAATDKTRQMIVYCQSGARSGQAVRMLQQQGYTNLVNGGSAAAVARAMQRPIVR